MARYNITLTMSILVESELDITEIRGEIFREGFCNPIDDTAQLTVLDSGTPSTSIIKIKE